MERVIDRAELLSEASTPPSSPDISNIPTLSQFEFVDRNLDTANAAGNTDRLDEDDDELDFQLFAPATAQSTATSTVARIRLETPEANNVDSGFIKPSRPDAYYFQTASTPAESQNFKAAALSGQEILRGAHSKWPGAACPWKVLEIPFTRKQRLLLHRSDAVFSKLLGNTLAKKHTRPGKKVRIASRVKAEAAKARQNEAAQAAASKQEAEQEKRTRRNREKKVKRKNRDKAKKADVAGSASTAEQVPIAITGSGAEAEPT